MCFVYRNMHPAQGGLNENFANFFSVDPYFLSLFKTRFFLFFFQFLLLKNSSFIIPAKSKRAETNKQIWTFIAYDSVIYAFLFHYSLKAVDWQQKAYFQKLLTLERVFNF